MKKPPSPHCIGCCSIIIPQTDEMMPYCQECIQGNEDIAADYHRLLDGQPPLSPLGVRVVLGPIELRREHD